MMPAAALCRAGETNAGEVVVGQTRHGEPAGISTSTSNPYEAESFQNLGLPEESTALVPGLNPSATDFDMDVFNEYVDMVLFIYYNFIRVDAPGPAWSHNASIMEEEGCFHVPARPAMDDFVRLFFLYVQPFMPLIDEGHFWKVYSAGDSNDLGKYSLFVVQALLFMACPALFDNDCCRYDVSKAQGALMLTYHYSNHLSELISTYWLDTTIHFASRAGADILTDALPPSQARKRLWWCCILRDNIMSLGLRRHLSIRRLKHVDCEQFALTGDDFENEIWNPQVCKPDEKQIPVRLFTSLCKLGIVLRDVLELVYSPEDDGCPRATVKNCQGAKAMLSRLDL
ncbi:hypothetical protein QQZ08_009232 [Neonectria magnoliae]|uniref:Transcription factor domain-containing protein n=1 Tax=Neonectria magnoliae TaxID=2732573 RepID=A0ABR1HQB6_9HYPO